MGWKIYDKAHVTRSTDCYTSCTAAHDKSSVCARRSGDVTQIFLNECAFHECSPCYIAFHLPTESHAFFQHGHAISQVPRKMLLRVCGECYCAGAMKERRGVSTTTARTATAAGHLPVSVSALLTIHTQFDLR